MNRLTKFALAVSAASLFHSVPALADAGLNDSYIVLSSNINSSSQFSNQFFQDLGTSSNPLFEGYNLGTYNPSAGDTLTLNGGETDTYNEQSNDVIYNASGYYDVVLATNPVPGTGVFTQISEPYESSNPYNGYDHQKWGTSSLSTNLLTNLPNGTYDLYSYNIANDYNANYPYQYFFTPTDSGPVAGPSGQNYYAATFTVVPEPSTIMMLMSSGLFGSFYLLRRKRR